jgi:hypothetical protein
MGKGIRRQEGKGQRRERGSRGGRNWGEGTEGREGEEGGITQPTTCSPAQQLNAMMHILTALRAGCTPEQ